MLTKVDDVQLRLREWGYYLEPADHKESLGYSKLVVLVRHTAVGHTYYHVQDIYVGVLGWHHNLYHTTFGSQPIYMGEHQIPPGQIYLNHHTTNRLSFYTFGGTMEVASYGDEGTLYTFSSPAPILALNAEQWTVADFLAAETEAMLAKLRGQWPVSSDQFAETLLALYNPAVVYMASIHSILQRHHQHMPFDHPQMLVGLTHEKQWLDAHGQWIHHLPVLEALPIDKEAFDFAQIIS